MEKLKPYILPIAIILGGIVVSNINTKEKIVEQELLSNNDNTFKTIGGVIIIAGIILLSSRTF